MQEMALKIKLLTEFHEVAGFQQAAAVDSNGKMISITCLAKHVTQPHLESYFMVTNIDYKTPNDSDCGYLGL